MREGKRNLIQGLAALISNGYLAGFVSGKLWKGASKQVCVPGLNCYSCPGALGACPIGSLQSALAGSVRSFPYYVVGTLLLFGVTLGRLVCGFLCPFGFVQDLLYKVRVKKGFIPKTIDRILRYLKYIVLAVFVILLPFVVRNEYGLGDPWFCKYICPAGTLEGGIPLVLLDDALRGAVGFLFSWKMLILVGVLTASLFLYRPFCKYLCPLGAFYGLFNKIGFYRLHVDHASCIQCGACDKACKMDVDVRRDINSPECIRCGACREACPRQCIHR
ncbi:MAG: 4Fe-4S binding protein [Clostridiaceae bacterium]|nr:4Fe-4S binding protein [Clostridiaceae bacterium]